MRGDQELHDLRERMGSIEADIKWLKWITMAAASSGIANLFLAHPSVQAAVVGALVFVVGIVTDLAHHFRS